MTIVAEAPLRAADGHAEFLRAAGYWLHLTRAVEDAGLSLYKQGRIPGSFYAGRGQEATAVGAALALEERDVAFPLIRDMAVHLIRGITPSEVFRHYLGKAGAPMRGRDGNVHLGSIDRGTVPLISHLPEMLPVAAGVALGRSWRGERAAALAFCGDGAANGGVWHETMNLASIWHAPLVVLVERNGWAYMTPSASTLSVERVAERAPGYRIPALTVDGNDVLEVHGTMLSALELARSRPGPVLVEAFTYRMHGHGAHDDQRYVPAEELEHWAERDPLRLWRSRAETEAGWTAADQDELESRVRAIVEQAVRDALEAPYPPSAGLVDEVFAR